MDARNLCANAFHDISKNLKVQCNKFGWGHIIDKFGLPSEHDAYKKVQGTRKIHFVETTANIDEIVVHNLSCISVSHRNRND